MSLHWGRLEPHTYVYVGVAIVGLLLTTGLFEAGTFTASTGPLHFDGYYAAISGFSFLFFASVYLAYTQRTQEDN